MGLEVNCTYDVINMILYYKTIYTLLSIITDICHKTISQFTMEAKNVLWRVCYESKYSHKDKKSMHNDNQKV